MKKHKGGFISTMKYTMLDYVKHKAVLGEILLDCPAKFILSSLQLWHDFSKGLTDIKESLSRFDNSATVINKIVTLWEKLKFKRWKYGGLKDPAMKSLWLYGTMCKFAANIMSILYKF